MKKETIEKLVSATTKECTENFSRHAQDDYTLASLTTIPFATIETRSRNVNDWGTEEDEDKIICFSERGWEILDITVQFGAGIKKVISHSSTSVSQQYIIDLFDEMDLFAQIEFIHSIYKVLLISKYKSELY